MLRLLHPYPSLLRNDTFSRRGRRCANDQHACSKNLMFEKLSPSAGALVPSRHSRPHEGLSRVVLKVRAGSGACGMGLPDPVSREAFANGISRDPRAATTCARGGGEVPSCPPVRHYDRSAPRGLKRVKVANAKPDPRRCGTRRTEIAAHGRRATGFLNLGTVVRRPCPLGSFWYVLACGDDDARVMQ